jgi:tetratricopeptide (TPR) repeat protein
VADYQAKMLQQVDPAAAGFRLIADLRTRHDAALGKAKVPEAEKLARTAAFERELHAVNATDAAVALLDRTVLAPAVRAIEEQFADQPLVGASLRTTLGAVYRTLGRSEESLALHRRAYELRGAALGEEHQDTLAALTNVVDSLADLQRLDEAEPSLDRLLESYRRTLGPDHPDTLAALTLRGTLLQKQGKLEEWEDCARDVLERRSRLLGTDHPDTLSAMNGLGVCLLRRDKHGEAERLLRTALEAGRRLPSQRRHLVNDTLDNLSRALNGAGQVGRGGAVRAGSARVEPPGPRRGSPGHAVDPQQSDDPVAEAGKARRGRTARPGGRR